MEFAEKLKEINKKLDESLEKLRLLEEEKMQLMQDYENADLLGKSKLEEKLKVSEKKFRHLSEEVLRLKEDVTKMRNKR